MSGRLTAFAVGSTSLAALAVLLHVRCRVGLRQRLGVVAVRPWRPSRPRLPVRFARRAGARQRAAQLPAVLDAVAAGLRAGRSLRQGLGDAVALTAEPLAGELATIVARARRGQPLHAALDAWAAQSRDPSVALVADALALGAHTGGGLARAAESAAATLRDRADVAAEVRALASQARASAAVLVLLPPAFAAMLAAADQRAAGFLLGSPTGMGCLAGGVLLDVAGAAWMARITRAVS